MVLLISSLLAFDADAAFGRKSAEKQRTDVLEMREEILTRLYMENRPQKTRSAVLSGMRFFQIGA
jgi:hypothetical protein